MYRVAAMVVAYRDKKSVVRCINALLSQSLQLQLIIIVDNSEQTIFDSGDFLSEKVHVIANNKNIGVASGLNKGFEYAINNGCNWCWTFDQDSEPLPNALEELIFNLKYYKGYINIGIISSTGVSRKYNTLYRGNNAKWIIPFKKTKRINVTYECDLTLTAGSLTNLDFVKKHGGARSDMFIDWVDFDMCIRMRSRKYKILCCQTSYYLHQIGGEVEYSKDQIDAGNIQSFRLYMLIRNATNVIIHSSPGFIKYLYYPLFIIKEYLDSCNQKKQKIFLHAIVDGINKNTTNIKTIDDIVKITRNIHA